MDIKKCEKCGFLKSIDAFYTDNSMKDGKSIYCKHCDIEMQLSP